jgi:hypothetical protein
MANRCSRSFMVRGKKNYLPPALLVLGFGLLFRISDQSKGRHVKHRLYDAEEVSSAAATSVESSVVKSRREDAGPESNSRG